MRGGGVRRAVVEDVRGGGQFVRLTWHGEGDVFVLSHWRGDVCVAASRFGVGDAADLVGVLVEGMTDVATRPPQGALEPMPSHGLSARLRQRLAALLAPPPGRPSPPSEAPPGPASPVVGERWADTSMLRWRSDDVG